MEGWGREFCPLVEGGVREYRRVPELVANSTVVPGDGAFRYAEAAERPLECDSHTRFNTRIPLRIWCALAPP